VAREEGIKYFHNVEKDVLIELILEAKEEDRNEREQGSNSAIRVEEKKYELTHDEELTLPGASEDIIAHKYNENSIFLLLRDPLWAFAYWDVKTGDIQSIKSEARSFKLLLRVFETEEQDTSCKIVDSFDIPIKSTDSKWYINLPRAGRAYFIALLYRIGKTENELCRSNVVRSPQYTLSDITSREKIYDSIDNTMLVLSGLYDLVEVSSFREDIPQRIITMVDTYPLYR
jgi:hypothetical protein